MTNHEINANAILEAAPDLYLILNPRLEIVGASNAYLKATKTIREEILGRGIFDVFPDNPEEIEATGVQNLRASLMIVLEQKIPNAMAVQKYDIQRPPSEGGGFEERYWSPLNSPVLGSDNQVQYIIHRVQDVTEYIKQHQLTEELRLRTGNMELEIYKTAQEIQKTNKLLQAANKDLESFAYVASHDLKAPLRALDNIVTWIEDDRDTKLSEESTKLFALFKERLQRMHNIIEGVLKYSRAGRIDVEVSPVNTKNLLCEILKSLNPPHEFTFRLIDPLPVFNTTKTPLDQVFSNLISNSIKYHHRKDGIIEISMQEKEDFYEFSVKDDGPGIDPKYHEKIFEIFSTLQSKDKSDSTGIGLSIVKKIILSQGGKISINSNLGHGANFIFTWPKEIKS